MLVRPVLEMGCLASLPERVADENKRREMGEYVLGTTVAGGRSKGESKLVLLSGAASCPARRESRCLDNTVSEVSLSRG
jgi:hypothetical protein